MNVDALAILDSLDEEKAKEAIRLFKSPRNSLITHINKTFEVVNPTTKRLSILNGVTTSLKAYVWPHYNYSELTQNVKYLPAELRGEKPPPGVSDIDGIGFHSGSRRGTRVHSDVELYVHGHHASVDFQNHEFHPITHLLLDHVINPGSRRAVVMSRDSVRYGLGFDEWVPLAAEFKLYDEDSGMASAIDLICINEDGILCFIEVKVGHAETWHSSCGVMNGTGSSQVALTPLNQALVQVGIYGIMARCKYDVRNIRMVVLNVNYSGVREFCVTPDFLIQVVTPIYLHLRDCIRVDKQQRIADRKAKKAERKRLRRRYGRAFPKRGQSSMTQDAERKWHTRVSRRPQSRLHEELRYPTISSSRRVTRSDT